MAALEPRIAKRLLVQAGSFASLPWAPRQLFLVVSFELLPLPLSTPLYSAQTFFVVPQEPLMVAVSPKLELMPMRSEVMPKARTFSTMTLRGDFLELSVQSPQER
jgi:hypothetical protein